MTTRRVIPLLELNVAAATRERVGPSRRWAAVGLVAQVVFVVSWVVAAGWQGPHYSVVSQSISDMYAVTAPYGEFLVVTFTVCGAVTLLFALRSVWPTLRSGGVDRRRRFDPVGSFHLRCRGSAVPVLPVGVPNG